jgi:hypothetical protein
MAAAPRAAAARRSRPPRPPEGTPPLSELARRARNELIDAVRLARWADAATGMATGTARPGAGGILRDADVQRASAALRLTDRQVRAAWDRARLAGLIELHKGSARPGWRLRAWDRDDTAVLRGWVALFDAWSLAHPADEHPACEGADPSLVAEVVEAAPQLLSLLHLSSGPVAVAVLLDLLRQRVAELREERHEPPADGSSGSRDELPQLLDWTLDALARVGSLHPRGPGSAEEVTITALGSWAVWVKLEQICVAAQGPAGNIEQSAEEMLKACVGLSPRPARAEHQAWLAARPVAQAVAELLDVARGDDALLRGLAFEVLRSVGAPAEPAVRAVTDEPSLRPYALMWIAEQEGGDPDAAAELLTREEATWLWVDTAAAVAEHGESHLLVSHLEAALQGSVPRLLAELTAIGHPRTVQVLVALASAHPDPALAKAMRRAAFQVHTGAE